MKSRPDTYHDWRRLWHSVAKELGWHVFYNVLNRRPLMDRITWRLIDQMRRVQLRLQVEAEAGTLSWCQAMREMLFRKD